MTLVRIATFNLENLDDKPDQTPTLGERIAVMRPQLQRVNADILCLQEVNGQESPGQPRQLLALQELISGTQYSGYEQVSTMTADGQQVYDERNLVILSRFPVAAHQTIRHDLVSQPQYRMVTAEPAVTEAQSITWERPLQHATVSLPDGTSLHVLNAHLKSRIPTNIPGQKVDSYTWSSVSGWAEGYFISSMKRVGAALEARALIDQLFAADEQARIVMCGDLNADLDDVPVKALRGDVEDTGNGTLATRVMFPCEQTIPEPSRYTLFHHGKGNMLDHVLASRSLLALYRGSEVHNEMLHDESVAFAMDDKYPESDHAPVIATFEIATA